MGLARQTVESALELNNRKDWAGVASLYAPDAKITIPPGTEIGVDELGAIVRSVWKRFPDWRYEITNLVEEGLTAAYEGTEGGTSPDGSRLVIRVAVFVTVDDAGKIVRVKGFW